jgi:transposase
MKKTQPTTKTAGIDVSKNKLDIAILGEEGGFVLPNTEPDARDLAARLNGAGIGRVGLEATGGYERTVMRVLQQAGLEVVLLQPLQVRAFAKLRLQRAKNDRIDARLIAACTQLAEPSSGRLVDPRFDALGDHLTFIEQTEADIARLKTRLEHIADTRLRRIAEADIKRLQTRRRREMARLLAELREHEDLAKRFDLVCSIPGCGERTALTVVVRMPELGQVSREEAAALAGLAPFVHQSGKRKGETHIGGGRSSLRRALYLAALPAASFWNPGLQAYYARLTGRGKPPTSALTACARKLLVYANAVVARGTPWTAKPA